MITDTGIIKRLEAAEIRVVDSTKSKGVTVMKFANDESKIVSLAVTETVSDEEVAKIEAEAAVHAESESHVSAVELEEPFEETEDESGDEE